MSREQTWQKKTRKIGLEVVLHLTPETMAKRGPWSEEGAGLLTDEIETQIERLFEEDEELFSMCSALTFGNIRVPPDHEYPRHEDMSKEDYDNQVFESMIDEITTKGNNGKELSEAERRLILIDNRELQQDDLICLRYLRDGTCEPEYESKMHKDWIQQFISEDITEEDLTLLLGPRPKEGDRMEKPNDTILGSIPDPLQDKSKQIVLSLILHQTMEDLKERGPWDQEGAGKLLNDVQSRLRYYFDDELSEYCSWMEFGAIFTSC